MQKKQLVMLLIENTGLTPPGIRHHLYNESCVALRRWMVSKSSKHQLKGTLKLMPHYFCNTGRGLKTKKRITPGTLIISVPLCLLVTPTVVLNSDFGPILKRWSVRFTPQQLLSIFLMVEHRKGCDSDWHPFIDCMPKNYTLPHYFSAEEIQLLPPNVSQQAETFQQRARKAYQQVLSFCQAHWRDVKDWASWDRFRWAWCTVNSRSVFLETDIGVQDWMNLEHSQENNTALCPYLDLLNHTSTATVQASLNPHTNCYELVTHDTYQPHDEVYVNYGPHDNATLFLYYGFTLPCNVQNAVSFSVEDFREMKDVFRISLWEQKMEVLRANALCSKLTCTVEGVSWNLKTALTILAMDWNELQNVRSVLAGETPDAALAANACQMGQHLITAALNRSKKFLADKHSHGQVSHVSPHQRLALSLVMDDINILSAALQDIG